MTENIAIKTHCRGSGHGRALGQLVEAFARSRGITSLLVNADPDKTGYYNKLGFSEKTWSEAELTDWKTGKASPPIPVQMLKQLV